MPLFLEDSQKVTKKKIPIPQNAKKVFKAMKKIYEPYLDKNIPGSKILKSLGSDKEYNKKGSSSNLNGKDVRQDYVNVNDAKVRLHRMNKLPKNSVQYELNGGELAANIYKKGIERARSTKEVEAVKPPKPTSNAQVKPPSLKQETVKVPNGTIKYTVTNESKVISESADEYDVFYEYLEDYGPSYVFDSFLENSDGKQTWGERINPNMYVKALREFTYYGKLMNFPSKYVYRWMGIIMRNTAILLSNSMIAGHHEVFPYEELEYFLHEYLDDDRELYVDYNTRRVKFEVSKEEAERIISDDESMIIRENAVDKFGQTYLPWVTQDEADRIALHSQFKSLGELAPYIKEYNKQKYSESIEVDYENAKIYWSIEPLELLGKIGLYDWMKMPDGSDAWSDYAIDPLYNVLKEYNEELPPEKVLIIVNKALDLYHQRGDLSSIFIVGGSKSLSKISEGKDRGKKRKIYINEKQIVNIKQQQQCHVIRK